MPRKKRIAEGSSNSDPVAAAAFADAYACDWVKLLARKETGAILPTLANAVCILQGDPAWAGVIAFDEFAGRTTKRRAPPFNGGELGEWRDADDAELRVWSSNTHRVEFKRADIQDAVEVVARRNPIHPVREYLDALAWDGKQRLPYWLRTYCGAELPDGPSEAIARMERYLAAAGTKWLVSAVARVYLPGCKADHVLVLEGDQGLGKSTVFAILAGPWFTDAPLRIGDKDAQAVMRGKWILELAELDSLSKAENAAIKAFFSQYTDRYRAHYERRAADVPRQQVFGGTVNHRQWLRDETGGRRFWPVWCTDIDLVELRAARDQLWAEAVHLYRKGQVWSVEPSEVELFAEQQDARYVGDAWETRIAKALRSPDVDGNTYERVTTADVLTKCLHLDSSKWTRAEQIRVGIIMQRLGWPRERDPDGERLWSYRRPSEWS